MLDDLGVNIAFGIERLNKDNLDDANFVLIYYNFCIVVSLHALVN